MEQLTFELAAPEPPTFANFLAGRNVEAVATLAQFARRELHETGVMVWGVAGSGRTHLLRAVIAAAGNHGTAAYYPAPGQVPTDLADGVTLIAVDDIDTADARAQGNLFTLFNRLQATGRHLLAAAAAPPGQLPLRDDLRTRLGWGLVFEIEPLADADKPAALAGYARERGFRLGDDVIAYLLAHGRRDMTTLVASIVALDRYSLAAKRPITVPLLREWLQREIPLRIPPA